MNKIYIFFLLSISLSFAQDTIRVATYNLLNYSGSNRTEFFHTVINEIDADIILVQEMINQTGVNAFKTSSYQTIPFHNGTDTDNHIFYKSSKLEFIQDSYISTALRDIAEYKLRVIPSNEIIYFYSAHLKASQGSDNEQKRFEECSILVDNLPDSNYIVAGDFNFYKSSEPGYQELLTALEDPLDAPGDWHNNSSFTDIHTQSTRVEQFGGGATGGLDDRFDFILISNSLQDNVLSSTYTEFGNDGNHFNQSINNGVTDPVIDALYYASDHLPVYCDFVFNTPTSIKEAESISSFDLYQNYPNPFNPITTISFRLERSTDVRLIVYNSIGQVVTVLLDNRMSSGLHEVDFEASKLGSGIYYYKILTSKTTGVKKMLLIK